MKNTEIKISQYADDTTLILDGSQKSLSEALKVLKKFSKASGLRLNSKKTEALWIGSCAALKKTSIGKTRRSRLSVFGYQ